MTKAEERLRVLQLIASGEVTPREGAQLLDALPGNVMRTPPRSSDGPQQIRVIVTDLSTRRQMINVAVPVGLIGVGMKLGARLSVRRIDGAIDDVIDAIAHGTRGLLVEFTDLEAHERIEIFAE